jgi:ferredoxin
MADKKKQPGQDKEQLVYDRPREEIEVLPGVRRYQFISKSQHRMLTKHLNRIAMVIIALALTFVIFKAVFIGTGYSVYCLEDRSCMRVLSQPEGENCPEFIYPVEMVVASRTADYERFIRQGGLRCIQCGNCTKWCILEINIPEIAARMQELTLEALAEGKVSPELVLEQGFIDPQTREPLTVEAARARYARQGYEKVARLYDEMLAIIESRAGEEVQVADR